MTQARINGSAQRAFSQDGSGWFQRVGGFTSVPALIRRLGGDPVAIMTRIGLAPDSLDEPEQRIPYTAMGELFQEAARSTGCSHFGLLCGRAFHLSGLGLVGDVVRNSSRVGAALRSLAAHQHLNGEGELAFLLQDGDFADVGYAIYHPRAVGASQIYDALIAGVCNFMRELCGASWAPSEVYFPHARPANIEPYRHFFRAALRFDSEFCALRFPADWLDQQVQGADPLLLRKAQKAAESAAREELLPQVYRAVRVLLLSGKSSGDDVAQMLSMHRRTLNRHLAARGETFHGVLDRVRFGVARELLEDTHVAMDDIAAALGYAGVTPFMRSFRRWSDTTPGQWRRTARGGRPVAGKVTVDTSAPALSGLLRYKAVVKAREGLLSRRPA